MKYTEENGQIWDKLAENNDVWTVPVTSETVEQARKGNWHIVLTPTKAVPRDWFPNNLEGKKVLCLASGGGQQG
ncbi:MAG: SAM-dependent methyltransferase, partial [Clostridiales bacterium]|nr:SAM-dependent methyltransferase [Clostridiales bacterium]